MPQQKVPQQFGCILVQVRWDLGGEMMPVDVDTGLRLALPAKPTIQAKHSMIMLPSKMAAATSQ